MRRRIGDEQAREEEEGREVSEDETQSLNNSDPVEAGRQRKVKMVVRTVWAATICVFALCCTFVSVILMFGSGYIFSDIDQTEAERHSAEIKAAILSCFGFVGLCLSGFLLSASGRIVHFILRLMGLNDAL